MSDMTERNAALAREYLEWQRRRNRSPETLFIYTDVLNKLLAWIGGASLGAASTATLEGFVDRPRKRRRPEHVKGQTIIGSPATRRRDITILRSFYRYLAERGHIGHNPALLLVPPKVHNVQPRAIDDDVWKAVWSHPSLDADERLVLGLGFFCGLRRREIVDLRPAHIDTQRRRIQGFNRKGGLHESFAYGSAVQLVAERLPALLPNGPEPFLHLMVERSETRDPFPYLLSWGDHLGSDDDPRLRGRERLDKYPAGWTPPNLVNKRLRSLLRRCGLPADAFTPHALRHSFVSNLLRAGVPLHVVSRLAAHADPSTTMRYVRTGEDPLRDLLSTTLDRPRRWD